MWERIPLQIVANSPENKLEMFVQHDSASEALLRNRSTTFDQRKGCRHRKVVILKMLRIIESYQ